MVAVRSTKPAGSTAQSASQDSGLMRAFLSSNWCPGTLSTSCSARGWHCLSQHINRSTAFASDLSRVPMLSLRFPDSSEKNISSQGQDSFLQSVGDAISSCIQKKKKRVGSPGQWLPRGKCFLESLRPALFAWQGLRHWGMLWTMKTMQTPSPHYPSWRALLQLINAPRPFRLDFVVITVLSVPEILQSSAPSTSSSFHCSTWLHVAHGWAACLAAPRGNFSW